MSDVSGSSKPIPEQDLQPGVPYKKGDFIGQKYEVYGILGKGGCGVVYLVYYQEGRGVYALKTFKDEFLADQEVRKRFHKEASVWVELGRHPYLVRALAVDEVSGRLYVAMEYIAPNEEGLNSLEGYLQRQPPDLAQSLRWAIQICHGMEYAYTKGVRAHRDLKPANIMIAQDKTAKITDFGLAGVLSESPAMRAAGGGASGLSGQTMPRTGFGTPTHMSPEQFDNAAGCDERSDIYSFGIMLYQMATGGQLPFPVPLGADWQAMRWLHCESPVPPLDSPLFPVIQRCLEKSPENRYQTFKEVRNNLEPLLQHQTGEVIIPPQSKELESWEWNDKGFSLGSLGRYEEAIHCLDKALELDPHLIPAWNNKGNSLNGMGRYEDAIRCFDQALESNPHNADAWTNKGASLGSLGRDEEAIRCLDKALELDPCSAAAWTNKGISLKNLGRYEEAIHCYDKALELDPRNAVVWYNKGNSLGSLGRPEEAVLCFDKSLEVDPRYANAWYNKGSSLGSLGRPEEAIRCFDKALELDPHYVYAWFNKALAEDKLSKWQEAAHSYQQFLALAPAQAAQQIGYARARLQELEGKSLLKTSTQSPRVSPKRVPDADRCEAGVWFKKGNDLLAAGFFEKSVLCFDKALELDPYNAQAWTSKGFSLESLGRHDEAIDCHNRALEVDRCNLDAWYNKARAEDGLGYLSDATYCYQKFLAFHPSQQYAQQIELAHKRLQELEGKLPETIPQQEPETAPKPIPDPDRLDAGVWYKKGNDLVNWGCFEESIQCYDKALALDPRDAHIWYNRGYGLRELGRFEEAIRCYDKALALDPRYVNAWHNKGDCLDRLGRHEEAIHCFDNILQLDPHNTAVWYTRAIGEDELGHSAEAVFCYQQFLALNPRQDVKQIEYARRRLRELGG